MAKFNMKPDQKFDRIAGQMEDFLLDPGFEFEVVEPKGISIYDTVAKIKVNEVLKQSDLTQVGSLREVFKYKTTFQWSLIPLKAKSKEPRFQWKKYTKEPASDWQLGEWWTQHPDSNIAVITGKISNLIVIDIDHESAFDLLEKHGIYLKRITTAVAKTHRGYQYFFNYHSAIKQRNFDGGEIRTDGHYVVIPPSVHPEGTQYTWEHSPFDVGIADIPESLIKFTSTNENAKSTITDNAVIPMGLRNNTLTSRAGTMRRQGADYEEILADISVRNKRCDLPLTAKEITTIAESVSRYPTENANGSPGIIGPAMSWECLTTEDIYSQRPPVEFILEGIFVEPSLNMIYGRPGDLKTMLGIYIAASIANGSGCFPPYPGHSGKTLQTQQAPVIWLDADMGKRRVLDRFAAIGSGINLSNDAPISIYSMPTPWPDFNNFKHAELLCTYIEERRAKFVVIDNLANVKGDADENSAGMAKVLSNLRWVMEKTESIILLIHHPNKSDKSRPGDKLRGHSSIEAALDLALFVTRAADSRIVTIKPTKARDAEVSPLKVEFSFEHKSGTNELASASFYRLPPDHDNEDIITNEVIRIVKSNPGMNQKNLREKVNAVTRQSDTKIRKVISKLEGTELETKIGTNNSKLYYLKTTTLVF